MGLRKHPDMTKILSNQSTISSITKRHIEVGEMSIEMLSKNESVKYLGQRISFHQQETLEIKSRIRAAWATFHKYRQELTSKIHAQTSSTTFRRHSLSDCMLRSRNMDTEQGPRKKDSIDATQDVTTHYPDKKKIQKKLKRKILTPKKKRKMLTSPKFVALMTKATMVRAQSLKMMWTAK